MLPITPRQRLFDLIVGGYFRLEKAVDIESLTNALNRLIGKYDSLRLRLTLSQGQWVQSIEDSLSFVPVRITPETLKNFGLGDIEWMQKEHQRKIAMNQFPLFEVALVANHCVYLKFHHLIMDSWAINRFVTELIATMYSKSLPEMNIMPWMSLVDQEYAYLNSSRYRTDQQYWIAKLKGQRLHSLREKFDWPMPSLPKSHRYTIDVSQDWKDYISSLQYSSYEFWVSMIFRFFSQLWGWERPSLVSATLGRSGIAQKNVLGCLTNLIPIGMDHMPSTFDEVVAQVNRELRESYRHARFPVFSIAQYQQAPYADIVFSYDPVVYDVAHTTEMVALTHAHETTPVFIWLQEYVPGQLEVVIDLNDDCFTFDYQNTLINLLSSWLNGGPDSINQPIPFLSAHHVTQDKNATLSIAMILEGWRQVLGIDKLSPDSGWLEFGGDSLAIFHLAAWLRKVCHLSVSPLELYKYQTPEKQFAWLSGFTQNINISRPRPHSSLDLRLGQQRILNQTMLAGRLPVYNLSVAANLKGEIDEERLKEALVQAISHHESLHFQVVVDAEHSFSLQKVPTVVDIKVEQLNESDWEQPLKDFFNESVFLMKGPLFALKLFRLGNDLIFALKASHLIADGYSIKILTDDMVRAYRGERLCEYQLYDQFDEVVGLNQLHPLRSFWSSYFRTLGRPILNKTNPGQGVAIRLASTIEMTSLQQWLGSRGILLKSFLECVWGYVWARNQASEEVVVGTVDWGRPAGFENTVGLFENIIPVRFEVRKHAVDSGVIEDLLPQLEYFYSFPDVRFESLLEVNKSSAWFHSMIVVFPQGINRITVDPDFWVDPLIVENSTAKIPYLLQVFEEDNRLATRLEVSTDVYVAEKAKNILDSFVETINLLIK